MKEFTVISTRDENETSTSGTIPQLIKHFEYTLDCGRSYQHEAGNKKINTNPKTVATLVKNLNAAACNRAANGCASTHYSRG